MKVLTCEATAKNGVISVSGTTENGMLAVSVSVYDKAEKELVVTPESTAVIDNKFSYEIPVSEGDYVVKMADYEGGEYCSKAVTLAKAAEAETKEETKDETTASVEASKPDTGRMTAEGASAVSVVSVSLVILAAAAIVVFARKKFMKRDEK